MFNAWILCQCIKVFYSILLWKIGKKVFFCREGGGEDSKSMTECFGWLVRRYI